MSEKTTLVYLEPIPKMWGTHQTIEARATYENGNSMEITLTEFEYKRGIFERDLCEMAGEDSEEFIAQFREVLRTHVESLGV